MASTSTSQTFVQMTSPEEGNWLSLGRAFRLVLYQSLRPFVKREIEAFCRNLTAAIAALPAGPCTCVYNPRKEKNRYHDMSTCAWAKVLQTAHLGNKPNWKKSDSTKWLNRNIGPWEKAYFFIPDIGGHTESVEDVEITGILNLMFWCNHFTIQRPLIKRCSRNSSKHEMGTRTEVTIVRSRQDVRCAHFQSRIFISFQESD